MYLIVKVVLRKCLVLKALVLILIFTFCGICDAFATVDYLAVNKITKEIYSFDQEQTRGIFWTLIREGTEYEYEAMGYTYADNPYTLDNLLTLIVLGASALGLSFLWKKRLIKRSVLLILFYLHLVSAFKYVALYSSWAVFDIIVSLLMFVIPAVIFVTVRMIENARIQRYSLLLQVIFTMIFTYLLFLQLW
jgi:hypothetical protein